MPHPPVQASNTDKSDVFLRALSHPIRRAIIAHGAKHGEINPKDVAVAIKAPLGDVSYHARELRKKGLIVETRTERRRGALAHFYAFAPNLLDDLASLVDLISQVVHATALHSGKTLSLEYHKLGVGDAL